VRYFEVTATLATFSYLAVRALAWAGCVRSGSPHQHRTIHAFDADRSPAAAGNRRLGIACLAVLWHGRNLFIARRECEPERDPSKLLKPASVRRMYYFSTKGHLVILPPY